MPLWQAVNSFCKFSTCSAKKVCYACLWLCLRLRLLTRQTARPTIELVNAARALFDRTQDTRFLVPIVNGLPQDEYVKLLPHLISLPVTQLKSAFLRSSLTPAQLLFSLHLIPANDRNSVRNLIQGLCFAFALFLLRADSRKAIKVCFEEHTVFNQEVLAMTLQQLSDCPRIPKLTMRTVFSLDFLLFCFFAFFFFC